MSCTPMLARAAALLLIGATWLPAQAAATSGQPAPGRWLIQFHPRPALATDRSELARVETAADRSALITRLAAATRAQHESFAADLVALGGRVVDSWWLIDGCAVELPTGAERVLHARPEVAAIWPDCYRGFAAAPIRTSTDAAHHAVDALHTAGILGTGVSIAVLDTGQDSDSGPTKRPHPLYFVDGDVLNQAGGGIAGSRLLANHQVGFISPDDFHGHGTQIATVAAGERWNSGPNSDRGHAPRAGIVGYSLPDFPDGLTLDSTIVRAWQQVVADRDLYATRVANLAYYNSPDPTHPTQQALDAAVLAADIVVAAIAGNTASQSSGSPSNANGIAVGAVGAQRQVTSWSTRGPLHGDPQRFFPDIVAQGDLIWVPKIDAAGQDIVVSGTSFATPQVAGAALLYRSLRPRATALETKAAILATTEDISAQNPSLDRNAYGLGYLRDDRLAAVARGDAYFVEAVLTPQASNARWRIRVQKDLQYRAVLVWHRHVLTSRDWSNLTLEAYAGSTLLARSATPRNLYEQVAFTASADGYVDLIVRAESLEIGTLPYAVVVPGARNEELGWQPQPAAQQPPARTEPALAADPARGRLLLFGGLVEGSEDASTWLFNGTAWTDARPTTAPSARRAAAIANDERRARIVLFGGRRGSTFLDDHWEWDGTRWISRSFGTRPSARARAAMTWDPSAAVLWLHGGENANGPLDDLWRFDGISWTRLTPGNRPAARAGHALGWDPTRERVVLFGGRGQQLYDSTWLWSGSSWQLANVPVRPSAREGHALVHDLVRGNVLLVGGDEGTGARTQVWELNSGGWIPRTPIGRIPARTGAGYAYLPQLGGLLCFGGAGATDPHGDLWLLSHRTPATAERFGIGCGGSQGTPSLDLADWERPHLDRVLHLALGGLPKTTLTTIAIGASRTSWNGLPLPFDLTGHAMPGCSLLVGIDLYEPLVPDSAGIASLVVPWLPQLAWQELHLQLAATDASANGAGLTVSNGLTLGLRLP